ncbi:N(2)-acetyl-L-2,4-diaminobutanoate deacetylase DoeB2 [Gilvimarinus sp. SDUM040013]|uniref:N(2)-acetyl-L-2,4-diaminobutanoate deacetylase DoeB2 n=1 Tax=Gilvimarinus gilvus TaxID=3058038 RepID=A0ABU4RYG8_9GAMM|nr:N(2)-acetyl-L-2,4-diaminobutanoate deacetylase DoeB2 [Gilvimarinus sp. SDUM040013]MDO3387436.1 N(2)-acetyl-L-2,4-diaminobutanoate deacetylase DoeB2 [Gilvimarinus sp. SDUM040013]MDX6849913.1 N(2)-acetyl-L-2,4-diaminobutanoate deacetylase DoeB2 [Gilvimarinus sp. SDUM040013]
MTYQWPEIISQAKVLRRHFHSEPELGWQEHDTAQRIRDELDALGIQWRSCAETGTLATLASAATGSHIALRGDIDALPINERTGQPWSSNRDGCMHACGHDGHTAALLAAAMWLKKHEADLPGPVTLLFQPAEEGGHGAREMINDGALAGVDCIYGWHNWPAIEFGKLVCPDGIVMCGNGTFEITLHGVGGHASQPELCSDPVLAVAALVQALQQIVSRRLAPQQATVVSVTSIDAPSGPTVIPEVAKVGGSIRVSDRAARDQVNQLITDISKQVASAYGVRAEVEIIPRYDATINHAEPAQKVRDTWPLMGDGLSLDDVIAVPIMASEDFSYYLKEIPGAFALIGADDGDNHHYACHNPQYDFNDRLIEPVVKLFSQLVGAPMPQ